MLKKTNKYIIACHGYTSKAAEMGVYAIHFADKGYSVLMPDARAHGESEGNLIGMGWPERFDILKWIDKIIESDPEAQIVLYGISRGAATVMMTSGENLPDNVKAVIEDCGYSSVFDELKWMANSMGHVPSFPLVYEVSLINELKSGFSLKEASAVEQVKKALHQHFLFMVPKTGWFHLTCLIKFMMQQIVKNKNWLLREQVILRQVQQNQNCTGQLYLNLYLSVFIIIYSNT